MSIRLPREQYVSYDENGTVLTERAVKIHNLGERSESGPGICATLRTGYEPENDDGVGVALSITDEQLEELGYLTKEKVGQAILSVFPEYGSTLKSAIGKRVVLASLAESLGVIDPYELRDKSQRAAIAEPAPDEDELTFTELPEPCCSGGGATCVDHEPVVFEPKAGSLAEQLGVSVEVYQAAVRKALPGARVHLDPECHPAGYECYVLEKIRAAIPQGGCFLRDRPKSQCLTPSGEFIHQ